MRRFLAILSALTLPLTLGLAGRLEAQRGPVGYGGAANDNPADAVLASDGSIVVAGTTSSFGTGSPSGWILAVRPDGSVAWDAVLNAPVSSFFFGIAPTADSGYLVAGRVAMGPVSGELHGWLGKWTAAGNLEWQETIGSDTRSDSLLAVAPGPADTYYVGGQSGAFGDPYRRPWLGRLDATGALAWQRWLDFGRDADLVSLAPAADGGVMALIRASYLAMGWEDASLVHVGPAGNVAWSRLHGTWRGESVYRLSPAADGGFFLGVGVRDASDGLGATVLKVDSLGMAEWRWTFRGLGLQSITDVLPLPDGGVLVAVGEWPSVPGIVLARLASDGRTRWVKGYGSDSDNPLRLLPLPAGGDAVVASFGRDGGFLSDIGVLYVDDDGNADGPCWSDALTFTVETSPLDQAPDTVTAVPATLVVSPAVIGTSPATPMEIVPRCPPPPGEVAGVMAGRAIDDVAITWSPLANAREYEVYRGTLPARMPMAYDHDTRIACSLSALSLVDAGACRLPASFYYLIVGRNATARGPYGQSSRGDSIPASLAECP